MQSTTIHPAIERIAEKISDEQLERMTEYTLADALEEGSDFTGQAIGGWRKGDNVCALSTGFLAAVARGYIQI